MGVTGQSTAITAGHGVSTDATGMPGLPIPGTPQLKTPSRPVRLVTVPRAPISAQMVAMTSSNNSVPQTPIISMKQIQDKNPPTITTIKQEPPNETMTTTAW